MKTRLVKKVVMRPWRYTGHQRKTAARWLLQQKTRTSDFFLSPEDRDEANRAHLAILQASNLIDHLVHLHGNEKTQKDVEDLEASIEALVPTVETHLENADMAEEVERDYDALFDELCLKGHWTVHRRVVPRPKRHYQWVYRTWWGGCTDRPVKDKHPTVVATRREQAQERADIWNLLRHLRR